MPNVIDSDGLQIKTRADYVDELENGADGYPGFFGIYGADVNLEANSPDGQLLNLIAQIATDVSELLASINAGFDPDQAVGVDLDDRCAINGVVRQGATSTVTLVTVTVDRALTLAGLETAGPFTVADASGNQFQLVTSYSFGGAGAQALSFRAVNVGAVQTTIGTITNVVTPVAGIVSVNNPAAATSTGQDQESDAALRVRRQKSVSLPSRGFLQGLLGALLAIDGLVQAVVYENVTNATDANGVPAHSIWVIVIADASLDDAIANAIYLERNAGCGMKGATVVNVPQVDGTTFAIEFDHATLEALYINFDYAVLTGADPGAAFVRTALLEALSYQIGQTADVTTIVALVKSIAPNLVVTNEGVSLTAGGYASTVAPSAVENRFLPDATTVYINGSHG